jgi:hypothetical protein
MHLPFILAQTTPDEWTSVAGTVAKVGGSFGLALLAVLYAFRLKIVVIGWVYTEAIAYWQKRYDDSQADSQKRYDALCKERDALMERLDRVGARSEAERQRAWEMLLKIQNINERAVAATAELSKRVPTASTDSAAGSG